MFVNLCLFKEMLNVAPKCTIAFIYSLFERVFTNLCLFRKMLNASVQCATIFIYFIHYYSFIFIVIYLLKWDNGIFKETRHIFLFSKLFSVTYYMIIEVQQCCFLFVNIIIAVFNQI